MKRIAIIGGGISGLAVLHYLKQSLGNTAEITLFEREASVGGTIRTLKKDSCLFEWGPNGFLDHPATLALIDELNLKDKLVDSLPLARKRYIQVNKALYPVPSNPLEMITTPLLTARAKWSLVRGTFRRNISKDSSIENYISRRFSPEIAELLVDPFISGIYAGNIRRLHMTAFPKFKVRGFKRAPMRSFKGGMGTITEALRECYRSCIRTDTEINSVPGNVNITIVATPSYAASKIIEGINPDLARSLDMISYAPVAVAGLLFKKEAFKKRPEGFGYLIPSREQKDILGVLVESNVYPGRAGDDEVMMRVMMGGAHHPGIINDSQEQLISKAIKEIENTFGLHSFPMEAFVKLWPKAIPQYEINYPKLRLSIAEQCAKTAGLYLCANYLDGISFNDCIVNARQLAHLLSS